MARAITRKRGAPHTPLDGTLVPANAAHKRVVLIEVVLKPAEDTQRIRSLDQDPGNPTVLFPGESRATQTHRSTTDPAARLANTGKGTAAVVGDTVNGRMENRHRFLWGINVETLRGPASETEGGRGVIDQFHTRHRRRITTVGADKGDCAKPFLAARFRRRIQPHSAAKTTRREGVHQRVRRMGRMVGSHRSQRARKTIEELWGEAKWWHGFRRVRRRGLWQVRDEADLMGWLLNVKRLSKLMPAPAYVDSHAGSEPCG